MARFALRGSGGASPGKDIKSLLGTDVPLFITWIQGPPNFDTTYISQLNTTSGTNTWDNKSGGPVSSTATLNAALAPDGSMSATVWTEGTNTGNHFMFNRGLTQIASQGFSNPKFYNPFKGPIRHWGIFKPGVNRTRVVLRTFFQDPNSNVFDVDAGFDLATGSSFDHTLGTGWNLIGTGFKNLGGGWMLVYFDANQTADVAGNYSFSGNYFIDAGSGSGARNISYTGDGASGLQEWLVGISPVLAWNAISNVLISDGFDSIGSIDVNNTQNLSGGYTWWRKDDWPNVSLVPMTNWGIGPGNPPTSGPFVVDSSILTWAIPGGTQSGINETNSLMSAFADPVTPSIVHGFQFVPNKPTFVQCRVAWGHPLPPAPNGPCGCWAQATEGLAGGTAPFGELDFFEAISGPQQFYDVQSLDMGGGRWDANNTFTGFTGNGGLQIGVGYGGGSGYGGRAGTFQHMHLLSSLFIPSQSNSNSVGQWIGGFSGYAEDGWMPSTAIFNWLSTDAVAAIENHHYPLFIETGNVGGTAAQSWPSYFDYVALRQ